MKADSILKFILCPLVVTICTVGFIIQIDHVSSRYMEYNTRTVVNMIITTSLSSLPSISACWSLVDFVKVPPIAGIKHPSVTGSTRKPVSNAAISDLPTDIQCKDERYKRSNEFRRIRIRDMTISKLFESTPSIDNLIFGCRVRLPKVFTMAEYSKSDCMNMFTFTKYFEREFVCYECEPKFGNSTFDMIQYTMSPSYVGEMYRIYFNKQISKCLEAYHILYTSQIQVISSIRHLLLVTIIE